MSNQIETTEHSTDSQENPPVIAAHDDCEAALPTADSKELSTEDYDDPRLIELEAELQQKEELVSALTERLEQAAEQLDRFRRSGADRGGRTGGPSFGQHDEDQQELVNELKHAVEQWETMQASASIGRVEIQIEELRDLIVEQFQRIHHDGIQVATDSSSLVHETQESSQNRDVAEQESDLEETATPWDRIKEGFLADEEGCSPEGEVEAADNNVADEFEEPPEAKEPPRPIDFGTANSEEVLLAVEERDDYISYLLKRLRNSEQRHFVPIDWERIQNAPDELRERLQALELELRDRHRLVEVELSLERARLARESAQLHQLETQVERNMRLMGIDIDNMDAAKLHAKANSHGTSEGQQGRKWFKFLGLKDGQTK